MKKAYYLEYVRNAGVLRIVPNVQGCLKNFSIFVLFFVAALFTGVLLLSCKGKNSPPDPFDVAAVSSGVLGRNESVIVEFTHSQDTSIPLTAKNFSISPAVKGTVSWRDEYTLVFTPSESYKPGQRYQVKAAITGIAPFNFDFAASIPVFLVELEPVRLGLEDDVLVAGTVSVDEDADISKI